MFLHHICVAFDVPFRGLTPKKRSKFDNLARLHGTTYVFRQSPEGFGSNSVTRRFGLACALCVKHVPTKCDKLRDDVELTFQVCVCTALELVESDFS